MTKMKEAQNRNLDWCDVYVDQSVTFSSWRKVEAKLSQILKQNVEKKLMDPVNRQIIFNILGDDFVNKYFSSYTNSPAVLDNIRTDEKEKKLVEMKSYIASVIDSVLRKDGPKSDNKVQSDLAAFSQEVQNEVEENIKDKTSEAKSKKKPKSDLHEKYLTEILASDPNVLEDLIPKLSGLHAALSDKLRLHIWPICISSKEKTKTKKNSEKVKDKFTQLSIKLQNSVDRKEELRSFTTSLSKVYKETNCIQSLESEENINSTAILLHICDSSGRKFQSQFMYFAIVLQQVYLKDKLRASDQDYAETAFMLDQVLRLGAPNSNRASKIVNRTCEMLFEVDKELLSHIENTMAERKDASNAPKDLSTNQAHISPSKKKVTDDISSHLQKWISSGFVSVLKLNTLSFIWDQLFLNKWENKVFQDISITLMGLLKPWFLVAKTKNDIEKVFMEEPGFLYSLDVRNALSHLRNTGDFLKIPSMNRNIKHGHSDPIPVLPPEPEKPKPVAPPPPPPKPVHHPPKFIPWVPCLKNKKEKNQIKNTVDLPFDLYIDSVRFVPDNSTVVKVTGKILNMYLGQKEKSIKFQAFPDLDSFWRYPSFKFKQPINLESIPMNPDVVVMMRVYTIENYSKSICVLGSCLFGPFSNKHGKQATLREGGHQIRIRHGIPDPDFNVEHMLASHMDDNPLMPGMTLLLRVLPHGKDHIPPPEYETNYYRSEFAKPNQSESKLYQHYQDSKDLSMTVRDAALLLTGQTSANDLALKPLLQQQLQKEGSDVPDFPYQRYVHYNQEHGMMVLIDKASGLPLFLEGRYLQCLAQIFPGEDSKLGDGKAQAINFITNELELDSPQRAPDWSDQPKKINPEYDDRAFVLVSLYGLRPRFDAVNQKLLDKEGREPKFNLQQAIAWSATPCFDKGSVFAGIHHIPLLKGRPPDDIIQKLSYLPLDYICKKFKSQVKVFEAASIELSIWDGHFTNNECPPLPVHTQLLGISSNPSKYIKASQHTSGETAVDLLKKSLSNPSEFFEHKLKIVELLNAAFKSNLDNSLIKSGYKATI